MGKSSKYSLADVIMAAIDSRLINTHTAIPGEIVSYKKSEQTAQVKVAIERSIEGEVVNYPILDDLPVVFPRSSAGGILFDLLPGDGCLLVFSERNLDRWRSSGSGQPPLDGRKFDISDAMVIPGLFPTSDKATPKGGTELRGEKIFVGNPTGVLTPIVTTGAPPGTPTGKPVSVAGESLGLVEAISALIDLVDGAYYGIAPTGSAVDTGGGGGIDAASSTALQNLKADLAKLKV